MAEPNLRRPPRHLAVIGLYALISFILLDHGAPIRKYILGLGDDPSLIIWFLAWWPHAIAHHLNPFFTNLVWQPAGLNLAWATCVPLLALLGLPFTLLSGPVLAFNVLTLAAPALAAWGTYLLCLHITGQRLAALLGGLLFGLSSYEMTQAFDHLNLDFTVFIPLFALVVYRRVDGSIGRATGIVLSAILLCAEFLISAEIFATLAMLSAFAWLSAYWLLPAKRLALRRLAPDALLTAGLVIAVLSPYLAAMFFRGRDTFQPAFWPINFSIDLLNLIIPGPGAALGGGVFSGVSSRFPGDADEQSGYLGLPLLLIIVAYAIQNRQSGGAKFLSVMLAAVVIAGLGPSLRIAGLHTGIILPWALVLHLPLIASALPARMTLYSSLLAAVIAASWIAAGRDGRARRIRALCGVFALLTLVPVKHPVTVAPYLPFFQPGVPNAALGVMPVVMILPFGIGGYSSFWQAQNQFGFVQTGGYLGFPPRSMLAYPAVMQLFADTPSSHFQAVFVDFCRVTHTQYIIATRGTPAADLAVLVALGWPERRIDAVSVYTVPEP